MENIFVDVAVPVSLFDTFLYKVNLKKHKISNKEELIGRRVLVPFKNTKHTGIIVNTSERLNKSVDFKIKEIEALPDKYPIYTKEYIEIIKKLSDYYISPIGMSLYYGMPDVLRWEYNTQQKKWNAKYLNVVFFPTTNNIDSVNIKSKRARELLNLLISKGDLSLEEIRELGFNKKTIDYLINKGLVEKADLYFEDLKELKLKSGYKVYAYSKDKLKNGAFLYNTAEAKQRLKTYINLLANLIYEGKSALLIFPNILSLKEAYTELKEIFGEKVYIYFDGLKPKDKVKTWFNLKNMKGSICLGTFSSIFIPIKNLSLIVIEEEHSSNYKMLRTPRFDTRRFAIEIYNKFKNISLIYSSSAPSVETFYLLNKGFLKEFQRGNILEYKKTQIKTKSIKYFEIINFIKNSINTDESTLIIANRTGLASFLKCSKCNYEIECPRCKIPLKIFKNKDKYLKCQICGKKYNYIDICPKCDVKLDTFGFGVEKIKQELKDVFGNNISFLFEKEKNTNIKITTTLNNKELIIPKFDKVINIFPDIFLKNGYKGDEEFFRNILISYLKSKKELIVLTNHSENPSFKFLKEKDILGFYKNELEKRKLLEYPPYANYILLTFEKKNLNIEDVENLFKNWIKKLNIKDIDYEGVFFSSIPFAREKFRYSILLKNFTKREYLKALFLMANKIGIRLIIDVAPRNI